MPSEGDWGGSPTCSTTVWIANENAPWAFGSGVGGENDGRGYNVRTPSRRLERCESAVSYANNEREYDQTHC